MSVEDNKAAVRRFANEGFNAGNGDTAYTYVSEQMIDHNPFPGQVPGPEGVKQVIAMFHAAFPDVHYTNEHIFGEGDLVTDHWIMEGTHQGTFMGIPPTGKRVKVSGIDIFRMADGKIVERWAEIDTLGMLQQLGAVPAPPQAAVEG